MFKKFSGNLFLAFLLVVQGMAQQQPAAADAAAPIVPGASRIDVYLPLLKGKTVGIFANQTSMVGNVHLVDTLLKRGVLVKKIFAPEHGFRGTADAGDNIDNQVDQRTGIPIISLYGSKQKPSAADLKDIDLLVFDIQDVGVRFFTYISSLQEFMEAAFENGKPLMLLDRPNPNGFYVDGPLLDTAFKSFVGMQPIPVVYGMTMGEYAFMIAGEKWLSAKANQRYAYYQQAQNGPDTPFHFQVIKCKNYDHHSKYQLPVAPSPNLPNMQSVYLYPSICYFEGTEVSLGRGTDKPFQQFGSPLFPQGAYQFTPVPTVGAKNPPLLNQRCNGFDLHAVDAAKETNDGLTLKWLMQAYRLYPDKTHFFLNGGKFFCKLTGNAKMMQQVIDGLPEADIRKSWQPDLVAFKKIRKRYLMYADFE